MVFTNFDGDSDIPNHKSTSRYVLIFCFGPICWLSKNKSVISISSAEVEYIGEVYVTIQEIWIQNILTDIGIQFNRLTIIWCDNQIMLKFCRDPM
jgi:hypothetical protein